MSQKIMIVGDVHGRWAELNKLISRHLPELILQCGDFGYWPGFDRTIERIEIDNNDHVYNRKPRYWKFQGIKNNKIPIHWCDGNHEDHFSLSKLDGDRNTPVEVMPNVFYQRRGSTLKLPDNRIVLFMGGADSTDKDVRTPYLDWFPEELITESDLHNLPETKVDIVISHTCPMEFKINLEHLRRYVPLIQMLNTDPSRKCLSYVLEKYRPSLWYFGHFHVAQSGFDGDCKWYAMNKAEDELWWRWLV